MMEEWRQVDGWPYEVSNIGKVRNAKGRLLATPLHKSGYLQVQLWNRGKFKSMLVHRLVAAAFVGKQPSELHEVAHGDGNRLNNADGNLRWVLHTENMRDRDDHGTTARGERNGKLKHDDETVRRIRGLHAGGMGYRRIAKETGVCRQTVQGIVTGRRRTETQHQQVTQ